MSSDRYVALLRGINVGGRNKVAMAGLRQVFRTAGYQSVATYIQTGNVLFSSPTAPKALEADIEAVLERHLDLPIVVVVRSLPQLQAVVANAPEGFGASPDTFHSDVVFLKAPLDAAAAMAVVQVRTSVDTAWEGDGVLYFQRVSARRSQSRMSRIAGTEEYSRMTIRNWSTTTRILALMQPGDGDPGAGEDGGSGAPHA